MVTKRDRSVFVQSAASGTIAWQGSCDGW